MKSIALLLLLAGVATPPPKPKSDFPGVISLPPQYTMRRTGTIDSDMGEITGPDGWVISYDIGYMAGTHMHERRKSECVWFLEHKIAKHKALTGVVREDGKRRIITTIWDGTPSTEPANFWATLRNEKDLATFLTIVTTYEPVKRR